jgi:hypothetical protein
LQSFSHCKHIGGESRQATTAAPDLPAVLREIEANLPFRQRP